MSFVFIPSPGKTYQIAQFTYPLPGERETVTALTDEFAKSCVARLTTGLSSRLGSPV